MSRPISYEKQEEQGLVRVAKHNYTSAYHPGEIYYNDVDRGIVNGGASAAGDMMTHRQMTHIVRSDDTALTNAKASILYSVAYSVATGFIIGAFVLYMWMTSKDSDGNLYALLWLLAWGVSSLVALAHNRAQGLHHSSTGIAHHEIQSRENIAIYAIDRHIELIERKWKHESRSVHPVSKTRK